MNIYKLIHQQNKPPFPVQNLQSFLINYLKSNSHQTSQNEFQDNILGGASKLEGQARKSLLDFTFQLAC